jgi:hypothetical protein
MDIEFDTAKRDVTRLPEGSTWRSGEVFEGSHLTVTDDRTTMAAPLYHCRPHGRPHGRPVWTPRGSPAVSLASESQ